MLIPVPFDRGEGDVSLSRCLPALALLRQAQACAADTEASPWDFAVEVCQLKQAGLGDTELRWLIKKRLVEHRLEATVVGQQVRSFSSAGGVKFTAESCFILTAEGLNSLQQEDGARDFRERKPPRTAPATPSVLSIAAAESPPPAPLPPPQPVAAALQPRWDQELRELWFGPVLVKRFRFRSPNQEMVLLAFQEEGWPVRIDDPLPPVANLTTRQRLHDAIKNLNRNQAHREIRFAGDGTGEGVRWERFGARSAS